MDKTDPIDILARTIWGEARGEGRAGMSAVASVVLNRADKGGWWGDDVIPVCLHKFQFSCWNDNDPNSAKLQNVTGADPAFNSALSLATLACDGVLKDTTNGATHYFVTGTSMPGWAYKQNPCAVIGRHSFYRNID